MADVHTREQRSRNMAAIRSRDTKPEIRVRSLLHSLGYRFRLHRRDLPGKPDIVLAKHSTVVFVHGCFWHCHKCRHGSVAPKTRAEFWRKKRGDTVLRDRRNTRALAAQGWKVVKIWECQTRDMEKLLRKIEKAMNSRPAAI
jgi:DNA mismatch endonuclease (patch repair protein)